MIIIKLLVLLKEQEEQRRLRLQPQPRGEPTAQEDTGSFLGEEVTDDRGDSVS